MVIMLGVATLIIVMSVMNGFRFELVNRILGTNGHVLILPQAVDLGDYEAMAARAAAAPGVTRAAPIIEDRVMATARAGRSFVLVRGVRPEDALTLSALAEPEEARGDLADFGAGGIAIGSGIADELNLRVGDKIKLVSSAGTGHYYTTDKNKRTTPDKLEMKKYDPVVRKHVMYKEAKIK